MFNLNSTPRLIFVDGPNASGKDYFIQQLSETLTEFDCLLKFEVIRATDFVLNADSETENRKYTAYKTEEEKIQSIFLGHIQLLKHINKLLSRDEDNLDLVIVNRSLLSFLIYNVYPTIPKQTANFWYPDPRRGIDYITEYINEFTKIFLTSQSLFINLNVPGKTPSEKVRTLLSRVKSRGEGKPVDEAWVRTIYTEYKAPNPLLIGVFDYYEKILSDQAGHIVMKYF
jgi:hypothetical protein